MLDRIAKAIVLALVSTYAEQTILPRIGLGFLLEQGGRPDHNHTTTTTLPSLEPPLPLAASCLPCGYGLVIIIVAVTYVWVITVGMSVGAARSKYSALAEKDGEKDVPERYLLPNLYAQGTSKHARAFNCVQRSHQQILETLPGYFVTVLVTGLEFPVVAFGLASLWLASRRAWVQGYAASGGNAADRYALPLSSLFWHAKLALVVTSLFVAGQLLAGAKMFG